MEKRISNQKITANLWFDKQAEAAVDFYLTVFKDGKIGRKPIMAKRVLRSMASRQEP